MQRFFTNFFFIFCVIASAGSALAIDCTSCQNDQRYCGEYDWDQGVWLSGSWQSCFAPQRDFATRCECIRNGGPDLIRVGFRPSDNTELFRSTIGAWMNNVPDDWDQCYARIRTDTACNAPLPQTIVRHCECVRNGGPDLIQSAIDVASGETLWQTTIGSWYNNIPEDWNSCYEMARNAPACY